MVILLRLDKKDYIAHIKDKDQILNMRRVLDKIEMVLDRHTVESTDFMDPYERRLARSIINRFNEISYEELGGLEEAERKIILLYPDYYEYNEMDIHIRSLAIEGDIGKLSHRDFLGALLNLGINREKIGDILINKEQVQLVVKEDILDFILISLERVANKRVKAKEIPLKDLSMGTINYKDVVITISSLRLDALISGVWNLSRTDSQKLIESDRVKVNWEPIRRVSKDINEGDIISVKGYGRFILNSIKGVSRKGRVRVEIRLLI